MAFFYTLLKFIHIAAAITAVGSNITYGVWNALAAREAAHMSFMLKGIKFLDDRIANPSYGVLFLTGLLLVFVGHWSITSLWIIVAIVLFVAVAVIGFAVFSPVLTLTLPVPLPCGPDTLIARSYAPSMPKVAGAA